MSATLNWKVRRKVLEKGNLGDFRGGTADGNLPANAEDTGSIPNPGRSYMPQGNKAHVPQL